MNSAIVTVLTPHGRRHNVKIQPNQTVLQILDDACKKYDFNSQDYDLIHHKRVLDLSSMFRFSGLPNNAQLEMIDVTRKREDKMVTLMLQLEDGSRLSGEFEPSTTVQLVLDTLCPDQSKADDVVAIYMRTELYGPALEISTLKSLGLTGGRAIMRMIHRNPDSLKVQANVSAPLPPPPKPIDMEEQPVPLLKISEQSDVNKSKETTTELSPEFRLDVHADSREAMSQDKRTKDHVRNEDTVEQSIVEPSSISPVERKKAKLGEDDVEMESSGATAPVVDTQTEEPLVHHVLGERNALLFSLAAIRSHDSRQEMDDIPDSFYELSVSDIQILLRDLKAQKEGLDDAPLLTAQMRELMESNAVLTKLGRYKVSVIRVQFPERLVLQGTFSPVDTVATVMEFVRPYLADPGMEFHLFSTPPKQILTVDLTLIESQCVPMALLHFGMDSWTGEPVLRPDLADKLSDPKAAVREASKSRGLQAGEETTGAKSEKEDGASNFSQGKRQPLAGNFMASSAASASHPSTSGGKIPKWFKPVGK